MLSFGLSFVLCKFLELLYPVYCSFKALKSLKPDDDRQWLTYWVVYAVLSTFESLGWVIVQWIPLYYELKVMFIIWLIMPQFKGARMLYDQHIEPFLTKHAASLDPIFGRTEAALESKYAAMAAQMVQQYGGPAAEQALKMAQDQAAKLSQQLANQNTGAPKIE